MPYSYETRISRNLKASRMNKYLRAGGLAGTTGTGCSVRGDNERLFAEEQWYSWGGTGPRLE